MFLSSESATAGEPAVAGFPVQIDGGERYAQCGDDTVLRAALRAGIGFPYECNSGGCGSCKFDLTEGEVEQLWPDAPGLSDRDRRKNKLLACQVRARSALTVKVRTRSEYCPPINPQRQLATLIETQAVTHDIREFRFRTDGSASFLPGQYAMLSIPGVESPRAYSMSNIANPSGQWQFQIRRTPSGKGTAQLFDVLKPGDQIEIDGPYGLAWLRQDNPRDLICIAGGSGLAPMVSIARGAAEAGLLDTRELHFFYGGRSPSDLCGESFLSELGGLGERLHFYPVVSLPDAAEPWTGRVGFVHEKVREQFGNRLPDFEFYFAGPPPMTQSISDMLMVEHRVPFEQVHFDRFF